MRPIVLFSASGASLVMAHAVPSAPTVTAAPHPAVVDLRLRQDAPNPISVAQVLLTAFPRSFYEVAVTNPSTIPSIIWQEFLDGSVPEWFANLPEEIRTYLIDAYIGSTAPPVSATPTQSSPILTVSSTALSSSAASYSPSVSTNTVRTSYSLPASSNSPTAASDTPSTAPTPSRSLTTSRISTRPSPSDSQSPSASSGHHSTSTSLVSSTSRPSLSGSSSISQTASPTLHSTTSPSKTESTSFVTATVTSSDLPPPAVEPTVRPEEGGLSRSSKIGLGVGVPVGVLAIAAIFGICFLHRRRKRAVYEKETDPDQAPFVTRAQLYDESHGGYSPYGPYAPLPEETCGFQGTTVTGGGAPVVGSAAGTGAIAGAIPSERRRRSLTPLDTNPFQDPLPSESLSAPSTAGMWDPTLHGPHPTNVGASGYTNLRSSPHRKLRRGSGASLRSIEEEADEEGDLAAAGTAANWNRSGTYNNSPFVSPVERDPMDPPFPRDISDSATQQKYNAFRSGSLKHNRRSSGGLPNEETQLGSEGPQNESPHRPLERRGSLTIGGGYRSLPSPHLQQPSQSYLLPRGEWLEDGEDLPWNKNRF